jgi:hypothetical protein
MPAIRKSLVKPSSLPMMPASHDAYTMWGVLTVSTAM